jgi:hypothetical protein
MTSCRRAAGHAAPSFAISSWRTLLVRRRDANCWVSDSDHFCLENLSDWLVCAEAGREAAQRRDSE